MKERKKESKKERREEKRKEEKRREEKRREGKEREEIVWGEKHKWKRTQYHTSSGEDWKRERQRQRQRDRERQSEKGVREGRREREFPEKNQEYVNITETSSVTITTHFLIIYARYWQC